MSIYQIDSSTIQPRGDRILVTRYKRPESYGSIIIPEAYDTDPSWNWWEVIAAGPEVEKALGCKLRAGDIVRTPFRPGIDLGYEDSNTGERLFMLGAKANGVNGVIFRDW